jgi:ankyrin repeat protein
MAERLLDEIDSREFGKTNTNIRNPLTAALHAAATGGHKKLVARLLEVGAPTTELEDDFLLVLNPASKGYTSIVRLLLDAGAVMDRNSSRHSRTALQAAVTGGHLDTARFLLERSADVNAAPARMKSPLHLACRKGNAGMVRMLLDAGADVYAVSYGGKSVRQSATKGGSVEVLRLIAEAEAAVSPPAPKNEEIDLATVTKNGLCSICRNTPFEM